MNIKAWDMTLGRKTLVSRGNGLELMDRASKTITAAHIQEIDSYLFRGAATPITDKEDLEDVVTWLGLMREVPPLAGAQTDEPQLVELPDDEELEELP